jgi:hypothetical protein
MNVSNGMVVPPVSGFTTSLGLLAIRAPVAGVDDAE